MVTTREQFIVDGNGRKTAVVLPREQYQKLLEDLHDLAIVAERRSEEAVPLSEAKRRLKEDGLP